MAGLLIIEIKFCSKVAETNILDKKWPLSTKCLAQILTKSPISSARWWAIVVLHRWAKKFPPVKEVVASVIPVEKVRYFAFSHVEACECNSLNERLAVAPQAEPFCSIVAAMVSVQDPADQPPRTLADGEILPLGSHSLQWHDTPHLPDGWGCGFLSEQTTKTLLCGDLFIQGGYWWSFTHRVRYLWT